MQMKSPVQCNPSKSMGDIDDLVVKRIGGGSIIDHRPLFSSDGETLYVVWKQVIRAYSTQTGDFVREFEPTDNRLTGIVSHPNNPNIIIGCTETGFLVTWDSRNGLITNKAKKLEIHDGVKVQTFHIINYKNPRGDVFCSALITYKIESVNAIQLITFDIETGEGVKSNSLKAQPGDYHVDIIGNYGNNLVALVQDVDLNILEARNLRGPLHKLGLGPRKFTCVAGHPTEECVATGDSTGRVVVWRNLFNNRCIQGSYHWHTLPVTEIVFSKSGGHMYTGGSECVLVKWVLNSPNQKEFLPRLPAPIKHLAIASENLYVAVSTLDNGIVVVNPQRKIIAVIQNFTWGANTSKDGLFPAGLTLDPRTNSLVLNSRTGYVQFFDTHTKSLLYNINITAQNLLTQERNAFIVNTEVTKIALNHDGSWMATVEERDDQVSAPEVRLKYWRFNLESQIFELNTSIELPHDIGVNALHFQPNTSLDGENILAVTTGKDKKFKLWNLVEASSVHKTTKHWQCHSVGSYRDLSTLAAGFSMDGSILGVSFESTLTIWNPETNTRKCSLTYSRCTETITRVEFGKHEACTLVIVASTKHIAVWDLLALRVTWMLPLQLSTLIADPNSVYMAAFTANNNLFIFTPQSSEPVYTKKNVLDDGSAVLGGIFVPHVSKKRVSGQNWRRKSQLFFLNSNQELLSLESESEAALSLETMPVSGSLPATAFSSLIATETSNNVERVTPYLHEHLISTGKSAIEELLTIPAHTLPPMRMLCVPFILSLRAQNLQKVKIPDDKPSRLVNGFFNDADSDDDGDDVNRKKLAREPEIRETKSNLDNHDESAINYHLVSSDWSFLASLLPDVTP